MAVAEAGPQPHPPILMGGAGPKVLDRVLEYADGWAPNLQPLDGLAERCAELQRRAADAGRGTGAGDGVRARPRARVVESLREIGIARAVVWMEPCGRDEAEAELDRLAGVVVA